MNEVNKYLKSKGTLTSLLAHPISWNQTLTFIRNLPYGRNSNRHDFSLVIHEKKGTCSSKHAALKLIAEENQIRDVRLILCIYKMDGINTPGIDKVLEAYKLDYIPEAHCYLNIGGVKYDFTNSNSDFSKIEKDVLEEIEISPDQVAEFKVEYHKSYVNNWVERQTLEYTFTEVWEIRERCIEVLTDL